MLLLVFLTLATHQLSDCSTQNNNRVFRSWFTPTSTGTLIKNNGYPVERHSVETTDGFTLGVYRIPKSLSSNATTKRPALILQHGFAMSSSCFALKPSPDGLPYMLVEAGFDVWIPNSRGTHESRQHKTLTDVFGRVTDNYAYYNYSFHELGYYDLPAVIDYVLEKTNSSDVFYVGHSQGTTMLFAMGADRPEYNKKIKVAAALAPVAYMNAVRGFTRILKLPLNYFLKMLRSIGIKESLYDSQHLMAASLTICKAPVIRRICYHRLEWTSGFDGSQYDSDLMPAIFDQGRATVSLKEIQHYQQIAWSNQFRHFDYGEQGNLRQYGQLDPPPYNLSGVTMPILLYYAENDYMSGVKDVMQLHSELPNSTLIRVNYTNFNHIDYMWAKDAKKLLYNSLIRDLRAHL